MLQLWGQGLKKAGRSAFKIGFLTQHWMIQLEQKFGQKSNPRYKGPFLAVIIRGGGHFNLFWSQDFGGGSTFKQENTAKIGYYLIG